MCDDPGPQPRTLPGAQMAHPHGSQTRRSASRKRGAASNSGSKDSNVTSPYIPSRMLSFSPSFAEERGIVRYLTYPFLRVTSLSSFIRRLAYFDLRERRFNFHPYECLLHRGHRSPQASGGSQPLGTESRTAPAPPCPLQSPDYPAKTGAGKRRRRDETQEAELRPGFTRGLPSPPVPVPECQQTLCSQVTGGGG